MHDARSGPAAFEPSATPTTDRLAAACGPLLARLAEVVGRPPHDPQHAVFLQELATEVGVPDVLPAGLRRLARALMLTPTEVDLVVLAGMAEEHEGIAAVLRTLHPGKEPWPTVGLAARIIASAGQRDAGTARRDLRATLTGGGAVTSGLLEVGPAGAPFPERTLRLPADLWPALADTHATPMAAPAPIGGLERWLDAPAALRARRALERDEHATIVVAGTTPAASAARASALAAATGRAPRTITLRAPASEARGAALAAVARGELPVIVVEPPAGAAGESSTAPSTASELDLGHHPGPLLLCGAERAELHTASRPLLVVPAPPLTARDRRRMWQAALPDLAGDADELATRHAVEPHAAAQVSADLALVPRLEAREATVDDVARIVRGRAATAMPPGATLRQPTAAWDSLVLPPDRLEQLREAVARLRHQPRVIDDWGLQADRPGARGVRLLLAGPPGTGKTLSAEVLAHTLGVDLVVVDLSRLVSKWVGETEKNLAGVFDAAERSQSVLLFDEADALFGRRTDVSDAHDRYANLETAYLLQRLESYEGLAILATNLRQNIDPAFVRRIEFVVEYDDPGPDERLALWECHLAGRGESVPLDDSVSLEELAGRFAISGALIRNAATAAAYLAAADHHAIGRAHLLRAVRREYDKNGRAFPGGTRG